MESAMSGVQLTGSKRAFRPPVVLVPRPTPASPAKGHPTLADEVVPEVASETLGLLVQRFTDDFLVPAVRCDSGAQFRKFVEVSLEDFQEFWGTVTNVIERLTSDRRALQLAERSAQEVAE